MTMTKLLDRYRQACRDNNLADYERLQDNEFLELIHAWLQEWFLEESVTVDHGSEAQHAQEIDRLIDFMDSLKEQM